MKNLMFLLVILLLGCESDKKFKKIEINPEDTKITKEKLNNSVKIIDKNIISPVFEVQQKIDTTLKETAREKKNGK